MMARCAERSRAAIAALLRDANAGHAAVPAEYEGHADDGRAVGAYVGGLPVLRHAGAQEVGIRAELIAERRIVADADTAAACSGEIGRAHRGARGAIHWFGRSFC